MVSKRPFDTHCNPAGSDPKSLRLSTASQAAATDLTHPRKRQQLDVGDVQFNQPPAKAKLQSSFQQLQTFRDTPLTDRTREKIATPEAGNILCKNTPLTLATALDTALFEEAEATLKEFEDARTFWSIPKNDELTEEVRSMLRTPGFYSLYYGFISTENNLHARISRAFACVLLYKLCCESYSCKSIFKRLQEANLKVRIPKKYRRKQKGLENYLASCKELGEMYCRLAHNLGGYGIVCFLPVIDDAIWRDHSLEDLIAELRKVKLDEKLEPYHEFASSVGEFGFHATLDGTALTLPADHSSKSKRFLRNTINTHRSSEPVTLKIIFPTVIRALKGKEYPAARMLSILHFLTSSERAIRKSLLLAAGGTQARWSSRGDHEHFDVRDLGLHAETFSILTDKERLQETLQLLEEEGTIQQTWVTDKSDVFITTKCSESSQGTFGYGAWQQALIFISFFFAGCECNNNFNLHGKWALPLFQILLDCYHKSVDSSLAEHIIPALLQASKFSDQQWKRRAIELVELMPWSSLASHVRAYFTYRKSLILRNRDSQSAKQAITTYLAYSKQLDSGLTNTADRDKPSSQETAFYRVRSRNDNMHSDQLNDHAREAVRASGTLTTIQTRQYSTSCLIDAQAQPSQSDQWLSPSTHHSSTPQNPDPHERRTPDRQLRLRELDDDSDTISPFGYHIDSPSIEELFRNITRYFEKSCGTMVLHDSGALLASHSADLCNSFDSHCFTATMFFEKGLYVEFRHALSKACALVEQILRAEHPRTLACFLEVLIHLIQTGLPCVTSYLREYIKRMSAQVIQKGNPWGQIYWHLGELDSNSLEQALGRAWKCTADIFDRELGTVSPLAVSFRLDYIKRVFGTTNHLEEEWLLRDVLAQLGANPTRSTPRVMLNLAHNLNRQRRHNEAENIALEVSSLLEEYEMYAERIVERIETLKIISRSHFYLGSILVAEQTIREAIQMIVDQWGMQHPWVPEFMNVLEGWLRSWSRDEEANALKGEIKELMREDEISEQLTGV